MLQERGMTERMDGRMERDTEPVVESRDGVTKRSPTYISRWEDADYQSQAGGVKVVIMEGAGRIKSSRPLQL